MKVNTETADRLGPYFRKEVTVNNSASAVWKGLNLEFTLHGAGVSGGDIVTQRAGHYYVAPATASPTYDEDGNLTSDSRWTYTWDGENRLVSMESNTTALSAGVPKRRLEFLYDGQSRRICKKVMDWKQGDWREPRWISRQRNPKGETSVRREQVNATTSAWVSKDERRYVYDGWNLVAEVDTSGNLIQSHTRGMDLSGTAQGAGGVGGLLWSNHVANTQVLFAAYDGNGNVVAMISTSNSKVKARYDYNAFGETVLQQGDGTQVSNPYRFSTKYQEEETGLCYYGYRYYNPTMGRWLNRDPIGERGGMNLYRMVGNDPVNKWDYLGLLMPDRAAEISRISPYKVWKMQAVATVPGGQFVADWGEKYHEWIKTDHLEAGMGNEEGVPGEGGQRPADCLCSKTQIVDHTGRIGKAIPVTGVDYDCIHFYLKIGSSTGPWFPLRNDCNTFVAIVISNCRPMFRTWFEEGKQIGMDDLPKYFTMENSVLPSDAIRRSYRQLTQ